MSAVTNIQAAQKYAELRAQLLVRREQLEAARQTGVDPAEVVRLLTQVDGALERMRVGTYGICEVCHDPVEEERLLADPLVRFCLDHLDADQARALEADFDMASRIQATLLPRNSVQTGGWEICYRYEPAGPVGGDYWDLIRAADGTDGMLFVLADVAGKGLAASLLVTHLHAIFHSLIPFGLSVTDLVTRANRLLCESKLNSLYATLVCGRLAASGEIELCNAGHLPPVLASAGGVISIAATGVPVGLFRESDYTTTTLTTKPGDSLLLYTDGLTEAQNGKGEYGLERVVRLAERQRHQPAQELLGCLAEDLETYLAGAPRHDDLTLVALRRLPERDTDPKLRA